MNKELCVILVSCFYNVNQALENWIHIVKTAAKDVPVICQTFSFDRLVYHFFNESQFVVIVVSLAWGVWLICWPSSWHFYLFFLLVCLFPVLFTCNRPLNYSKLLIYTLRQRIAILLRRTTSLSCILHYWALAIKRGWGDLVVQLIPNSSNPR